MKNICKKIFIIIMLVSIFTTYVPTLTSIVFAIEDINQENTEEDKDGPNINVESLEINKKKLLYGEILELSIEITDNMIDVPYACVTYEMPISKELKDIRLLKNESTGKFEGNIMVEDSFEKGTWKILLISTSDVKGNPTIMYNSNMVDYMLQSADLSAGDFDVIGEDTESPNINIESLEINKNVATIGDIITLSVDITDNYSVRYAKVVYQVPNFKGTKNVQLLKNYDTGKYEAAIQVDDSFEQGKWKIFLIEAEDRAQNITMIYNSREGWDFEPSTDLSTGNFTTITDDDFYALDGVNTFNTNTYIYNETFYGDIYIGPDNIVTLDNVTVNGDIYVYGGARLINVSAKSIYVQQFIHTGERTENEEFFNGKAYYYRKYFTY